MSAKFVGSFLLCLLLGAAAMGQQNTSQQNTSQQSASQPMRLTMEEAIHRGLQANLSVLVAESRNAEARGTTERRRSLLLPRVEVQAPAAVQSRSLIAQGISLPKVPLPEVVGPFSTYDARAYADQPVWDMQLVHGVRAAQRSEAASQAQYQDARDLVIRNVAALYLSAQAQQAETTAAASRVETAKALLKLARDQREAGVATGIDVLRAEVQLANEEQSEVSARNLAAGSLLTLARNIGLEPGTPIDLADALEFHALSEVNAEGAEPDALRARPDYQALLRQHESLAEQLRASRARFLPKLDLSGNYGGIGRNLGSMRATGMAQAALSITVFDRDREGEEAQIMAQMRSVDRQLDDARLGVQQEIRQALLDLDSAAREVSVSGSGLDLAEKELDLAQLRFSQGVTNNIEVTSAQDSLSRAQQNKIVALTHHASARISLARAMGNTEATYAKYLGGH